MKAAARWAYAFGVIFGVAIVIDPTASSVWTMTAVVVLVAFGAVYGWENWK